MGKKKYSRKFIEKVRDEIDLVIIASEYIDLKEVGLLGDFVGLCPFFHRDRKEKNPSFRIIRRKQFFVCHGCGRTGDVFEFIMKMEGLNFLESVEFLAKRLDLL